MTEQAGLQNQVSQEDIDRIDVLKKHIIANDKDAVIKLMTEYQELCMKEGLFFAYITHPIIITELHKLIVEHMGVNQRAMQLRRRLENRRKRGQLFLQAMMNGINLVQR